MQFQLNRLRLFTGLFLFAFLITHFINHALGLFSFHLMDSGRDLFLAFWRHPVMRYTVPAALMTHVLSPMHRIYTRPTLKMSRWEKWQSYSALLIPYFLIPHIMGTKLAHELYGLNDTYDYETLALGVFGFFFQSGLSVVVWLHLTIGLHFYLRLYAFYRRHSTLFLALMVLLPLAGIGGFFRRGFYTLQMSANPEWMKLQADIIRLPGPEQFDTVYLLIGIGLASVTVMFALVFAGRWWRVKRLAEKQPGVSVEYFGRQTVDAIPGNTILETSRIHSLAHTSVCGGRGRCSTCRVRIVEGADNLSEVEAGERAVLERIGAGDDVRLACQARINGPLCLLPLVEPSEAIQSALDYDNNDSGRELKVAVLFSDLAGFTALSEKKLPFDVVFLLNRYFEQMGHTIEQAGGVVDKFIGDGVMALFGTDGDYEHGCRAALIAAEQMNQALAEINRELETELEQPLQLRIGIHAGEAIIGKMGYGKTRHLTAIGDTVNTASRLEALNKKTSSNLVISRAVYDGADAAVPEEARRLKVRVRGREGFLEVFCF